MRPNKTPEQIINIVTKEELQQLYIVEGMSKEKISDKLQICLSSLNKILNFYNISKPNKYITLEELKETLPPEKFKDTFLSTSTKALAIQYHVLPATLTAYAKELNINKTQNNVNSYRNNILKQAAIDNWEEKQKEYPRDLLENLYIIQNKTQKEISQLLGISKDILQKLLNFYNIHKSRETISLKNLQYLYSIYGSKEKYHAYMCDKRKITWVENYGSIDDYKKHRSEKLKEAWESKSPDKQASIIATIIQNSKRGLNSRDSKPNLRFLETLKTIFGDDYIITREFPIGNRIYDFKINNILIEINPSITHNITFSPYGHHLDPLYHYNKTKLALENGYKCLCLWDWIDPKDLISLLQSDFEQTQTSPRRHLFNINTKSHIISQDEPFTPGEGWVEIWDDGSEINTKNS